VETTPIQSEFGSASGRKERVESMYKTLFVGCDVSSKENTVCLMDEDGKELSYPIFPNTLTGAKAFSVIDRSASGGKVTSF